MGTLRRSVVVGVLVATGVAGAGQQAIAAIHLEYGDVFCHAESPGPHYFHSRVERPSHTLAEDTDEWWPRYRTERRRQERETLQYMAAGFARHITENYPVDHLLAPRCELTESRSGPRIIERAAYTTHDGMLVPYEDNQKTAVDWLPNFHDVFRYQGMALSDRAALVIGNAAYEHLSSIRAPANDAEEVGAALERLGFDATILVDADARTMTDALRAFERRARGADIALVFYSGHGVEVGGVNYLVPVSARVETAADLPYQAVALDTVVTAVSDARVPIAILDADRDDRLAADNPLTAEDLGQGARRGIEESPVDVLGTEKGILLAYAATAGQQVYESGRHGIYTEALLVHLEEPGVELEAMFRRVGARVGARFPANLAAAAQRPVIYSTLAEVRTIRLAGTEPPPVPGGPPPIR